MQLLFLSLQTDGSLMVNTSNELGNYDRISILYEMWCSGDESYAPSLEFYLKFLRKQYGPFLELGVGTGRIALEVLRNQQVDITGVDLSKKMLEECGRKYDEMRKHNEICGRLRLLNLEMENIDFNLEFQTVYLPFRTVGHLMTDQLLNRVFRRVHRALVPGGFFVLDHYMFCREWAESHNDKDILMYEKDGIRIYDHYLYDFERERMKCSVKRNGAVIGEFLFRWIKPDIIRSAALQAGFHIQKLYGDFDGSLWTEESDNQIWVLQK